MASSVTPSPSLGAGTPTAGCPPTSDKLRVSLAPGTAWAQTDWRISVFPLLSCPPQTCGPVWAEYGQHPGVRLQRWALPICSADGSHGAGLRRAGIPLPYKLSLRQQLCGQPSRAGPRRDPLGQAWGCLLLAGHLHPPGPSCFMCRMGETSGSPETAQTHRVADSAEP